MKYLRTTASWFFILWTFCCAAQAQETDLAVEAERMRASLIATQLALGVDSTGANSEFRRAQEAFRVLNLDKATSWVPDALNDVEEAFREAQSALARSDEAAFAAARTHIWTKMLGFAYRVLERAVTTRQFAQAEHWFGVREYRSATRFALPGAEATLALEALRIKQISLEDALTAIRSDFLDAYQARLEEALRNLGEAFSQPFLVRRAELAAMAQGYFQILAPSYERARGTASLAAARSAFALLSRSGASSSELQAVRVVLEGFRAAPLSPRDRSRRASGIFRFLSLVPVEYERGVVQDGGVTRVVKDLEIAEAVAFQTSALNAFTDLAPLLSALDPVSLKEAEGLFVGLRQRLSAAAKHQNPPSLALVSENVRSLNSVLERLIPSDWRRADPAGDLDVIREQLRAIINAAGRGDLELAETTRLDAYAILESGPEARLRVFAPQLSAEIEELFWNSVDPKGFARLIRERASAELFRTTRLVLEAKLQEAGQIVGTSSAPAVVFTNSLVIVFREGFEAVLILAALLGSLKRPEVRHLRRPLWAGALAALAASVVTFFVMRGVLTAFAAFGEKLEAIVGVIAIAVLLVIMNWFFHNVYWTDRLAGFHQKKHQLMGAAVGQALGLGLLGFSAMYREGFETALFLQSLALQSGLTTVLLGALVAFVLVSLVGVAVFVLQTKLPHKKMLITTGILVCAVLFVMVGNTVHALQVVGWFPVHPIPLNFPYWMRLWLGLHPTVEGLLCQFVAVAAVIGSYFLAEGFKRRTLARKLEHAI